MKLVYIIIFPFIFNFTLNIYGQSYLGLTIGVGIDNIKTKERKNMSRFEIADKGYKFYYTNCGLKFEQNISKNFTMSLSNDFSTNVNEIDIIDDFGINPIVQFKRRSISSSLITKYILFDKLFVGIGLNSLFSATQEKRLSDEFNNVKIKNYSNMILNRISPLYIIGIKSRNILFEIYYIDGSLYNNSENDFYIQPIKSIGCSVSYLFKLPQRKNKKSVDCPKF